MGAKIPSEFVPLDVLYPTDRAIRSAGHCAELLFIRSLVYARKNKTKGQIPDYDLSVVGVGIPALARHAAALVRAELWTEVDGGWYIRSWDRWNPDQERREKQSEGGVRGNHTKWHTGPDAQVSDDCPYCSPIGEGSVTESVPDHSKRSLRIAEREREREGEREEEKTSSEVASATVRPDVDALLDLLDDGIRRNGAKVPARTKKNIDAARLLIDRDEHSPEQIARAIEFATTDEFWRSNILSMSKLREKYDQLRLSAQKRPRAHGTDSRSRVDENLDVVRQIAMRDGLLATPPQIGEAS
jgi:hypothetical protein